MNMNSFETMNWPRIAFGVGASLKTGEKITAMGCKKALFIYDNFLAQSGMMEPIVNSVKDAGIETDVFTDIVPESPDYAVVALAKKAVEFDADIFVIIGGGSSIDTARAASMYAQCIDIPFEECQERMFVPLEQEKIDKIKMIIMPTTAGTGAEMSAGGPLLNTKTNVKGGPFFGAKSADMVILDPKLTETLPPMLTYTTAMDAMSHALEGMTGKQRSSRSEMYCGTAIKYIWRSLPKAMADGSDMEARGELQLAANYAMGVETLRHLGHATCQPIGGHYHIAHGLSCAQALPGCVRAIADCEEILPELRIIAEYMGLDPNSERVGHDIADAIFARNREYGIKTLKEIEPDFEKLKAIIPQIMSDGRLLPNSPVEVTEEVIEQIIRDMYEG